MSKLSEFLSSVHKLDGLKGLVELSEARINAHNDDDDLVVALNRFQVAYDYLEAVLNERKV